MGEKVLQMVGISIDSLKSLDTELAKSVSKTEQEVDDMYFQYLDKLVEQAHATNQCTISSVLVVRYLERIADHATYIAEAVVYIAAGTKNNPKIKTQTQKPSLTTQRNSLHSIHGNYLKGGYRLFRALEYNSHSKFFVAFIRSRLKPKPINGNVQTSNGKALSNAPAENEYAK